MTVFPEEILECIFAHLEPIRIPTPDGMCFECDDHMQRETLASICRASKACNRIAYPYLYRTIHLSGFSSRPRLLLRSLLHNSKLAPEARILRISGRATLKRNSHSGDLDRQLERASDKSLRQLANRIVNSLHLSTSLRSHILAGVESKLEDCEIACIAAICPSMEVLDLPSFRDGCHAALMRIVTEIYGLTSDYHIANRLLARDSNGTASDRVDLDRYPLSRIQYISLNREIDQGAIGEALPLLCLPKLETFQANSVAIPFLTSLSAMAQKGLSGLRVLTFVECTLKSRGLSKLLECCPELHTLSICSTKKGPSPTTLPFGFDFIGRSLNIWGSKLQVVTLAASTRPQESTHYPLEAISDLRFLRVLKTTAVALFGQRHSDLNSDIECVMDSVVDLLPTSLEHLHILAHMGDEEMPDFSPAIMELWTDHRFANLQQVSFDRLAWTEKLLQMPIWDSSDSMPTRVVLKRAA